MEKSEIHVGHIYSARKPKVMLFSEFLNDRMVVWISRDRDMVQYDSPTVRIGRHLPSVSMDKFLRWAKEDITEQMQPGEWRKNA